MNSFSRLNTVWNRMDPFPMYRRRSRGFTMDPPAKVHSKILFGAGFFLTPEFVKDHKITHVINCASPSDTPSWVPTAFGDKYACINAIDSLNVDITTWYPQFETAMNSFLQSPDCEMVYVHCQAGINRSGFLTVLYCCRRFHYTYEVTCRAILVQRPSALVNHVFHKQVQDYIKKHR